jgi:hypothetical protein
MSKDVKPTRRAILVGAAAAVPLASTAVAAAPALSLAVEPDSVFAAIQAHRTAWAALGA